MHAVKNFAGLGIVVAINLSLQFLFQWYTITSLGAGMQTDAMFGSMALPQFLLVVLSGSLTMVLVPMISKYENSNFLKESWNYFQAVGLLFIAIACLLLLTSFWWVKWVLPGFNNSNYLLAVNLARINVVAMIFSALLSVVWAVHSARGNFFKIEYTSIAANIIAFILLLIFIERGGIYAVAWVSVLRILLQVLLLVKILGSYQKLDLSRPSFKIAWKKLKPLVTGNAYFQSDPLVDRHITSRGAIGQLTLLSFAQQLYLAANSFLVKVLVNTMIPDLTRAYAAKNIKRFNYIFKKRLLIAVAFIAAGLIMLFFFGEWLLGFIFSFRKMTAADVHQLWWLLVLLGGYLVGDLIGNITAGAFYAKGNTITPTRIGMVLFTIYIPVKIFCYFKFGIAGLAVCVSVYQLTSCLTKLFFLRRHLV